MNDYLPVTIAIVVLALLFIGRCDVQHAGGAEPETHVAADPVSPPRDPQPVTPSGGPTCKETRIMAWRPARHLIEGDLDNTQPGQVTGWLQFAGMSSRVQLDLVGDFAPDIPGAKVHLAGFCPVDDQSAEIYMVAFCGRQTGSVVNMTAGLPAGRPSFEWCSSQNGQVLLELEPFQVQVTGTPVSASESEPAGQEAAPQTIQIVHGSQEQAVCVATRRRQPRTAHPGHQLMPAEVRRQLPRLYAQESKGGKAIAYVKYFTPDSSWTWLATEFDGDDTLFGLVDGHCKELGYFSLSELQAVRGPLGLPIERDLQWKPTPLEQIAPELFERRTTKK